LLIYLLALSISGYTLSSDTPSIDNDFLMFAIIYSLDFFCFLLTVSNNEKEVILKSFIDLQSSREKFSFFPSFKPPIQIVSATPD